MKKRTMKVTTIISLAILNLNIGTLTGYANTESQYISENKLANEQNIMTYYVSSTNAQVLKEPNGYMLNTLNKGTSVEAVSEVYRDNKVYLKIKYGNGYGYINNINLTEHKIEPNIKFISPEKTISCNVYSEPRLNSKKVNILNGGETVEVIKTTGLYTEIKHNKIKGYVRTKYLCDEQEYKVMYINEPMINAYAAPSKSSEIIATISFGEQVEVIKFLTGRYDNFAEIKLNNGSILFIEKRYLSEIKPIEQNIQYADMTKGEKFKIYQHADDTSKEIGEVLGGEKLIIVRAEGEYTLIMKNGKEAYIKTEFLSSTPKYIEYYISNPNALLLRDTNDTLNILGTLNYKEIIQAQQYQPSPINEFVKIKYAYGNGIVDAYVNKKDISINKPNDIDIGYIDITSCNETNMYKNNSTTSDVIAKIPAGDKVIIKEIEKDMVKVIYNNSLGFIKSDCLSLEQKKSIKYVNSDEAEVLDSPQWEKCKKIGNLKKGDIVEIIKTNIGANNDFCFIKYKGTNGYVNKSIIS